ncbi:predicted protein [Coccidioides posadasii str. Silveira]|uniref:Predicted protein n=2 Tax=Coccidioides posadasii TaxID=199306 RepID=E9CWL7_COCPS|nr:predicted protein [Coccidioides posadasii str. Silveira]KMM65164.1 hypothetical protein CPAG_01516 [Coccidioides posadasii RMSCC 3488]
MGMEQFRRKSVQGRRSVSAQNPLIVVGHRGRRGQRRLPAKTKRSLDQDHQKMDEFRTHILAALITTVNLNKSARQWMPRHEHRGAIAQRSRWNLDINSMSSLSRITHLKHNSGENGTMMC